MSGVEDQPGYLVKAAVQEINDQPAKPDLTQVSKEIEMVRNLIGKYYLNSHQRSLAITKLDEAELWLTKATEADQIDYITQHVLPQLRETVMGIDRIEELKPAPYPVHDPSKCGGPGICLPCSVEANVDAEEITEYQNLEQGDVT